MFTDIGDLPTFIRKLCLTIPGMLVGLTLHEYAHGYVADRCGDPTPRMNGRLTLNPLAHLDLVGTLGIIFFGFGWAKPVPVNPFNFRKLRRDMFWVSAAGPMSNIMVATFLALALRLFKGGLHAGGGLLGESWLTPLVSIIFYAVYINVMLAVFNLVPIPPLDGSGVLSSLLPPRYSDTYSKIEPYGFLILMGLLFLGIIPMLIGPPINIIVGLLLGFRL